jgi:hypothetical protein
MVIIVLDYINIIILTAFINEREGNRPFNALLLCSSELLITGWLSHRRASFL